MMVRDVDSQWLEPGTFGSVLMKVTNHDTAVLVLTVNVVLLVVSVLSAADVALVSVFEYSCPEGHHYSCRCSCGRMRPPSRSRRWISLPPDLAPRSGSGGQSSSARCGLWVL